MFPFLDALFSLLETSDFFWCLNLLYLLVCGCAFGQPCRLVDPLQKGSHGEESPLGRVFVLAQNDCRFLLLLSSLALAIYDFWYGFTSRCNGRLPFENFSGLQSGPSHQICSLPGPVQHLPHQAVLYFQHSHYSPVCPGVKLVRHLPDAFCPFQWQLAGQPAGHLVCEYSFSSCVHLQEGTIEMWGGRDGLWILRHILIGGHAHWNS